MVNLSASLALAHLSSPGASTVPLSSFDADLEPTHVQVPQEVLNLVIAESALDPAALATWCRVSSDTLQVAGPLLYEEIQLQTETWEACLNIQPDRKPSSLRVTRALSFDALRRLSVAPSLILSLDPSKLGKLARRRKAAAGRTVTLSILNPLSPCADVFFASAGPLLAVLDPDVVIYNLAPFDAPPTGKNLPLGIVDVLEGEVLASYMSALSSFSEPGPRLYSTAQAGAQSATPEIQDDAPSFSAAAALEYLVCASDSARLAAEELLIRKIKTCLRTLTHSAAFATDAVLVRAFYADMDPCERAFERRFVEVPFGAGGLRAARAQAPGTTAECHKLIDWWMMRLGQPCLLDLH